MDEENKPASAEETPTIPSDKLAIGIKKSIIRRLKRGYIAVAVIYLTYKIFAYGCNYIGVKPSHVIGYVFTHTMLPLSILGVIGVFGIMLPKFLGITLPERMTKSKVGSIIIGILVYGLAAYALIALVGDIYNESQTHKFILFSLYKNFCNQ
jgi:hypothetical protein